MTTNRLKKYVIVHHITRELPDKLMLKQTFIAGLGVHFGCESIVYF